MFHESISKYSNYLAYLTNGNEVWSITDTTDWLGIYLKKNKKEEDVKKNSIIEIDFLCRIRRRHLFTEYVDVVDVHLLIKLREIWNFEFFLISLFMY